MSSASRCGCAVESSRVEVLSGSLASEMGLATRCVWLAGGCNEAVVVSMGGINRCECCDSVSCCVADAAAGADSCTSSADEAALGSSNAKERLVGLVGPAARRSSSRLKVPGDGGGNVMLFFGASAFEELRLRLWLSVRSLLPGVSAALRREPSRLCPLSWPSSTLLVARLRAGERGPSSPPGEELELVLDVGNGTVPLPAGPLITPDLTAAEPGLLSVTSPELERKNEIRDRMLPDEVLLCVASGMNKDFERCLELLRGSPLILRGLVLSLEVGFAGDCGVAALLAGGLRGSRGSGRDTEALLGTVSRDRLSTTSMVDDLRIVCYCAA